MTCALGLAVRPALVKAQLPPDPAELAQPTGQLSQPLGLRRQHSTLHRALEGFEIASFKPSLQEERLVICSLSIIFKKMIKLLFTLSLFSAYALGAPAGTKFLREASGDLQSLTQAKITYVKEKVG